MTNKLLSNIPDVINLYRYHFLPYKKGFSMELFGLPKRMQQNWFFVKNPLAILSRMSNRCWWNTILSFASSRLRWAYYIVHNARVPAIWRTLWSQMREITVAVFRWVINPSPPALWTLYRGLNSCFIFDRCDDKGSSSRQVS